MRGFGTDVGLLPNTRPPMLAPLMDQMNDQGRPAGHDEVTRVLGFKDVASIVISAIIGVGVFFTPAKVADRAHDGGWAILAWLVGAGMAILGGLTFAELGTSMPSTGGQFVVLSRAFGRNIGFVYVATVSSTVVAGALGILAIVAAELILGSAGVTVTGANLTGLALVLLGVIFAINMAGVRVSAGFLRCNAGLKLAMLVGLIGIGLFSGRPMAPAAFSLEHAPGFGGFCYATVPVLFAYGGWEQALWTGGEVRRPERNVVLGIFTGVAVVVVVYLGLNTSLLYLLGPGGVSQDNRVTARAVELVVPSLARWVSLAVAASALGTVHAIMMTAPRQIAALATEGLAPAALGRFSPRTGTPGAATTVVFLIAVALVVGAGKDGVDRLLDAVGCVNWLFFGMTGLAVVILRKRLPNLSRPYRVPGYPVTPIVFASLAFVAAASPFFEPAGRTPAALALGLVLTLALLARLLIKTPAVSDVRS